jgi:hypothetical protein
VKRLLTIGLVLLSTSAWAEWVLISKTGTGALFYVDPTTKKSGRRPRVWLLDSYATTSDGGAMSDKSLVEADCSEGRVRPLSILFYRDQQGKDYLRSEAPTAEWFYPVPNSVLSDVFLYLCGKAP